MQCAVCVCLHGVGARQDVVSADECLSGLHQGRRHAGAPAAEMDGERRERPHIHQVATHGRERYHRGVILSGNGALLLYERQRADRLRDRDHRFVLCCQRLRLRGEDQQLRCDAGRCVAGQSGHRRQLHRMVAGPRGECPVLHTHGRGLLRDGGPFGRGQPYGTPQHARARHQEHTDCGGPLEDDSRRNVRDNCHHHLRSAAGHTARFPRLSALSREHQGAEQVH